LNTFVLVWFTYFIGDIGTQPFTRLKGALDCSHASQVFGWNFRKGQAWPAQPSVAPGT
jgi:hypothetical protein